jgi:N-acetylmuramoyl-L-alanine amidase
MRRRQVRLTLAVVALTLVGLPIVASAASAGTSISFAGWQSLGGVAKGAPAATWEPGRLDVFVRGSDNHLWYKSYATGWSGWQDLGGPPGLLGSDPAAVSWSAGRIDVFVAGADGHLWRRWYAGHWSSWEYLGGFLVGAPSVASWGPGRLDVFVRGTDNHLWHKWYSGGWSGWELRRGQLTSSPAAVSWGPDRVDVFVRGTDSALWHTAFAGTWSGFGPLGGVLAGSPGVASWAAGRLDVFARGTDNRLYHQWFAAGAWSGWQLAEGGVLTSAPAAVSWGLGHIDVFVRGTDNAIWHTAATLSVVTDGAPATLPPTASGRLDHRVVLVDPGHNGGNFTAPGIINQPFWNGREFEACDTTGTATDGGYTEALFNWSVAQYLTADLRAVGAAVVLTRTSNTGVGPCVNERAALGNQAGANVAVSIHADGGPPAGTGFAILEPVADGINNGIINPSGAFGLDLRAAFGVATGEPVSNYDGVNGIQPRNDLGGLNLSTVPKVLIECGNMRNPADAARLVSPAWQSKAAAGIAAGMEAFL